MLTPPTREDWIAYRKTLTETVRGSRVILTAPSGARWEADATTEAEQRFMLSLLYRQARAVFLGLCH